jgi:pyruvate-formate lyase-activating enzyme
VTEPIDHRALYRLPWSLSDNVIAWLEPTAKCNLACEGCYRENVNSHKSLDEVSMELDVFAKWRKFDGVSIAGGDPLLHPQIVEVVRLVASRGHKPVLNTNGHAITEPLLRELKAAGLVGLTFHVDSKQGRPGWRNASEVELNALRLQLAELVARVGGLACAFNSTVYEDTLDAVPDLVQFAQDHIDIVHTIVFITYRAAMMDGAFDYYHAGKKIDPKPLVYATSAKKRRIEMTSREVVSRIRERFPDFAPSAYLGGTESPSSLKWLLTGRVGVPGRIHGYVGPRFMEVAQTSHHILTGRYVAYMRPKLLASSRWLLPFWALEPGLRGALGNYVRHLARKPLDILKSVHFQSVMVIQPIDVLDDGRQNMCDGCPDLTVHDGELVWSCRLEEKLEFGGFVQTVPKELAVERAPMTSGSAVQGRREGSHAR